MRVSSASLVAAFLIVLAAPRLRAATAAGEVVSSSACAGLRDRLWDGVIRAKALGGWTDGDPTVDFRETRWTRTAEGPPSVESPSSPPLDSALAPATPECRYEGYEEGQYPCTRCLDRVYAVDGDSVGFTVGRDPETCSESPRMRWRTRAGEAHEAILSPLYNWNVTAVWCTGGRLVLGMRAYYEYGESDELLAFWDLDSGRFDRFPDRTSNIFFSDYFPDWTSAVVASSGDWIVLSSTQAAAAFRPDEHRWALLDPTTRKPLPVLAREAKLPPYVPSALARSLKQEFPEAIGFTAIRADAVDGAIVAVYRADLQRVFQQMQWFDRAAGYAVARWEPKGNGDLLGAVHATYYDHNPNAVTLRAYVKGELVFVVAGDKGSEILRYRLR